MSNYPWLLLLLFEQGGGSFSTETNIGVCVEDFLNEAYSKPVRES